MSYTAEISRSNPACFVFLVDQSFSMAEPVAGELGTSKQAVVADVMNHLLAELGTRCAKEEGIRNFFHIAALGYGDGQVTSLFSDRSAEQELHPIGEIYVNPMRIDKRSVGIGDSVEEVAFPVWIEPSANGSTPMCKGLGKARDLVRQWVTDHPDSYPPIVLNLTDGESTDGDPFPIASQVISSSTSDGEALLFNLHVSKVAAEPISYPDTEKHLPDAFARSLYRMSSVLPQQLRDYAETVGYNVSGESRGFVYNANIARLAQFLDIGTRSSALVR